MRIGYGWDSHAFEPGVPLKIGGIAIDHPEGLAGHSDGDVLSARHHRRPAGRDWRWAISAAFFRQAIHDGRMPIRRSFSTWRVEEVQTAGYRIVNVDTTLVLAAPKIGPISGDMRQRVAELLEIQPNAVGIKAKTPEGLNQDQVARRMPWFCSNQQTTM